MRTPRLVLLMLVLAVLPLLSTVAVAAGEVAIINAKVLTMTTAGDIAGGVILISNHKILAVGKHMDIPTGARVINAAGDIVTPGLVAPDTTLGLTEIGSVSGTDDAMTASPLISAAFDVQYGLNPDSVTLPVARLGGITSALAMPSLRTGKDSKVRLFAGQAAMIRLTGSPDILLRSQVGMVLELGESGARDSGGGRGAEIVELLDDLNAAREFMRNRNTSTQDLGLSKADLAALVPVVQGRMPVMAIVHRAADIRTIIQIAKAQKIKLILVGAEEGWKVAHDIAVAHVPVILNPNADLPADFELLGATMRNAALLHAAGVEIAISGSDPSHLVSEMRYNAGIAVAHGLPYAAALEAITSAPARIFGVDGLVGSIGAGKDADLVIWNGDPLEPLTQPVAIFIRGTEQPLTSRQLDLARRYTEAAP